MKTRKLHTTIAAALGFSLAAGAALADVTTNQEAKPDDWNRSIQLQPMNSKQKSDVAVFTKENQLRCWQHGDLIVMENGFTPVEPGKGRLLRKGSTALHAFDYGETFCIYLGG
jgi:hypothetical protein